jgi:HPt (histidine-containing phosphotransfer) domain-containing protein
MGDSAPVLVACSASDENAGEQCREAGFAFLLSKPVTPESLLAVLEGRAVAFEAEQHHAGNWEMPESLAMLANVAGKSKVSGLLELFVKESERRIDLLLKTLGDKNIEVFARTAHSLRGSSAQMGAQKMAEISAELEQDALKGAHIGISKLVGLAKEFEKVSTAITAYLAE